MPKRFFQYFTDVTHLKDLLFVFMNSMHFQTNPSEQKQFSVFVISYAIPMEILKYHSNFVAQIRTSLFFILHR